MKKLLTILMAGLLIAAMTAPVFAWEFEMKGEYENRFRYFGRTGGTDLFGYAAAQDNGAGTFIGFAGPNIYGTGNIAPILGDSSAGVETITRGGFARWGSDSYYNDSRLTMRPVIRVNPAIRVHGVYTVGGMRNKYRQTGPNGAADGVGVAPMERYYMSQSSMNAYDGTFGTWEQFRATITMPWAIWSIGLKDFPLGTGATLAENTRAEAMLWVVPYGPFRLLGAIWLARGRFLESWTTVPDSETKPEWFNGMIVTYDAGEFSAGIGEIWRFDHRQRGATPVANYAGFNPGAAAQVPRDDNTFIGIGYFKFNNGRFFANAEYAWVNIDRYYPDATLTAGLGNATHIEAYHFFSEFGLMAGPSKLSLMYGLASGPVLNLNNNGSKTYAPMSINYQATEPYEFLMFNTYAGGNDGGWATGTNVNGLAGPSVAFTQDDHGQMDDAYCFAGRLDYAVAANLNLYGSYIWAHRLERAGYLAGGKRDTGNGAAGGIAPGAAFMGRYGGTTNYVPDGFLGWEVNLGADWKLLEGMTFRTRYSYWQPGEWFDFAYQAWGNLPGGVLSDGAIVKDKSPINALQATVLIEF